MSEKKIIGKRLRNAYFSSVVSISLVLLLVGVAAMLLTSASSVSRYFKENMKVSVQMKMEVSENEALSFQEQLCSLPFVKSSEYISREQGTQELIELLGEDFLDVFEASPVPVSVDMTLRADYVSADSLEVVKARLMEFSPVEDVVYQQSLVDALNANLRKISIVITVLIALLLFISYVLINNTVRLSVYARRFTVHTMRLVGATPSFIRAPFLVQSVFQGIFASLIATSLLVGLLFVVKKEFVQLFEIFTPNLLLCVVGIVVASGLLICVVSTYFAVNKMVSLKRGDLYY